jgi:hypothetical protein
VFREKLFDSSYNSGVGMRGVSGIIAMLVAAAILFLVIAPMLVAVMGSRASYDSAVSRYREFDSARGYERLNFYFDYSKIPPYYVKNDGLVGVRLVRAWINVSSFVSPYSIDIYLAPGDVLNLSVLRSQTNIPGLDLSQVLYLVSVSGSSFPVASSILSLSFYGSSGNANNPFSPSTSLFYWNFSRLADLAIASGDPYSDNPRYLGVFYGVDGCGFRGVPYVGSLPGYSFNVLSAGVNTSSGVVPYRYNLRTNDFGCLYLVFPGRVDVFSQPYAVVVYYRVVVSALGSGGGNRVALNASFGLVSDGVAVGSSSSSVGWSPRVGSDVLVWNGFVVVPVSSYSVFSGSADLVVSISLSQVNGVGSYYIGVEFLAFQGVSLIPV